MANTTGRSNLFSGILLILLGVILFLGQFVYLHWYDSWPLLIIGIGVLFLAGFALDLTNYGLLMPASILLITGTLFLYLDRTTWHNMSYLWPTFILAPGIGFIFMFFFGPAKNHLWFPGILLITIAALFYAEQWDYLRYWPVLLILLGIYLLVERRPRVNPKSTCEP